jgi:cytochrome c oxidase subunit I
MRAPEVVVDGFPKRRARWVEIATSADHKDVGRILIVSALGFLFVATIELLLMRLQLAIPENTFLSPVAFNRMLSMYGATAVFFFAVPLVVGFFHYVVPLQIGARWTALPRVSQLGAWLVIAGATVLYSGFLFTPSEAGVNPLPPLSELAFNANDGVDAWTSATGLATLGFVLIAIDLTTTMRRMRAPGMAWRRLPVFSWAAAVGSWLILVIGPVFLAALTMLEIDRNFDGIFFADGSGGAPLLWQHLSWIFFTGVYVLALVAALGAIAEIVSAFARKPLFSRPATIGSLVAIAVLGTLAWMQNMLTAPIGIGWMYFAMILSLALIVPFGLVLFNLIATLVGGRIRMRAPLLFAAGAISMISIGLAAEISHSMVAVAWQLKNTVDATAATHFALVGGAVFGGFAMLHFWFPKMTGRTMGETLARISFWTMVFGTLLAFGPLFLAGGEEGEVIDAYKFFDGTGVDAYNLSATIGSFVLAIGIVLVLVNAILSRVNGPKAGHDPWGGDSLEWFALSPPDPHNFDVLPDVRSERPLRDIREAISHTAGRRAEERPAPESQPVA